MAGISEPDYFARKRQFHEIRHRQTPIRLLALIWVQLISLQNSYYWCHTEDVGSVLFSETCFTHTSYTPRREERRREMCRDNLYCIVFHCTNRRRLYLHRLATTTHRVPVPDEQWNKRWNKTDRSLSRRTCLSLGAPELAVAHSPYDLITEPEQSPPWQALI